MISCIITTYNRGTDILKRSIDSVLNQTYKDKELIIVNDSPENIELCISIDKLLKEYNNPIIKYIKHESNLGACKARNTGIESSKGEFIAFLDDDDEWLPNKLEKQLKLFTSDDVGLVYCDCIIRRDGVNTLHKNTPRINSTDFLECLMLGNFIGGNSFPLIRKKILIDAGKYDERLKALQDFDMWIRIAQISKCVYCEEALVINHISNVSITTISDNRVQGFERTLEKYKHIYRKYPVIYHRRLLVISGELFMATKIKKGFMYYKMAINEKKFSIDNIYIPLKCLFVNIRKKIKKY